MIERIAHIHNKLGELNLDALLITNEHNIRYLTRFKGEDSYLLVDKRKAFFITDFRNYEEARQALKGIEVVKICESFFMTVPELVRQNNLKSLGFEAKNLDFATHARLESNLKRFCRLTPTFDLIEDFRQQKDQQEIKLIKKAIGITEEGFRFAKRIIRPGLTENELISRLEAFVVDRGAQKFSFAPIAASNKRSSFPHATSTDRKIGSNTALTLDMGVTYKGYKSDLTRVFFLGRIPDALREIYEIVLDAQAKAIAIIKAGISAAQVDRQARVLIAKKGFGRFFQHSTGHGIGLEVHEKPYISKKNDSPLISGMVFTVEPAIYIPDKFGVRIEDIVLVKENGCEVLSAAVN